MKAFRKTFKGGEFTSIHTPVVPIRQAVFDYYANLPQWTVDAVWEEAGETYVQVSPAGLAFYEPPDAYVHKCTLTADGKLHLEQTEWIDGTKDNRNEAHGTL